MILYFTSFHLIFKVKLPNGPKEGELQHQLVDTALNETQLHHQLGDLVLKEKHPHLTSLIIHQERRPESAAIDSQEKKKHQSAGFMSQLIIGCSIGC